MHSHPKKIILRSTLVGNGLADGEPYSNSRIDVFKVDDDQGHVIFTLRNDNHLFIYSYYERRIINKLELITQSIYSNKCGLSLIPRNI